MVTPSDGAVDDGSGDGDTDACLEIYAVEEAKSNGDDGGAPTTQLHQQKGKTLTTFIAHTTFYFTI